MMYPLISDQELRDMFRRHDKDMSGFISKDDVLCMLLGADKDEQKDPLFKTHLKFLINVIKQADKDGDMKISFEGEFCGQYIAIEAFCCETAGQTT
ncbi:EF hand [Teladorsagia circumcincta]|uniref:EF hand n=1 Tax=Teladorsagia circumcincta TaxID=45464 RepID=A0A2G9U9I9_TELCI|nr:EF hand [Teladorsagia circumcincta]